MFKLPEEIKKDIEKFRGALEDLRGAKISKERFRGIRVPWGIYSHRGGGVFMVRVRVPAGSVSPAQLKALTQASTEYGDGILHITTRQDIQIHNVKIEDTIKVIDFLKDYELSPRGGGGNTVRNIIGCPLAGICKNEQFDIRGDALSLSEYLLRQESSYSLPRKFKISFSGCAKDCAGAMVNDVGFIADKKDAKRGFKVFVGGGLGASSHVGGVLEEFMSEEDLGYCTTAVKNVYYKKGDRHNKHHNRLRFLIEDIGIDEFKRLYRGEFQDLKEKEHVVLREIGLPEKDAGAGDIPQAKEVEYKEFLRYNVHPQRQEGYAYVGLRLSTGDITAKELAELAALEKEFPEIEFRTSQNQDILITWVRKNDLYKLFLRLKDTLQNFLYADTLLDVVACKGALTCNLGLCNSPGLTREIESAIKKEFIGRDIFGKLDIKINGCPNACGQHPVGKLSFHGLAKRVDNRPVPFYKFFIGGKKEADKTALAKEIGMVAARSVPAFLIDFLRRLDEKSKAYTDIYEALEKEGTNIAADIINKYSYVPSYSENKEFYIDWEKKEDFSLSGLGTGECGAGVIDIIEVDLEQAKLSLDEASRKDYPSELIRTALFLSARALLIVKGEDPRQPHDAFRHFKEKFIDGGIAECTYSDIEKVFDKIRDGLSIEERKERFNYAKAFFEHINLLYKKMDSSFNFPKQETPLKKEGPAKTLDLKGTPCPINYVKTKLLLETLDSGSILEVILDEGEPIENVPKSLEGDGHKIIKIEKENGFYKVTVRKR